MNESFNPFLQKPSATQLPREWERRLLAIVIAEAARAMSGHRYKPVGGCIYCGNTEPPLSDEHIVPYGLGGTLILPQASCARCAKITSLIELHCLRGIYRPARMHLRLPSRKGHPQTLPVEMEHGDTKTRVDLTIADHPGYLFSFDYEPPYILAGFEKLGVRLGGRLSIRNINQNNEERLKQLKGKVHMAADFDANTFARMIAKIAYSYAVAERGYGTFRPLVLDAILRATPEDMRYVIGGRLSKMDGDGMHRLSIEEREVISQQYVRRKLLIVNLQLFRAARHACVPSCGWRAVKFFSLISRC